jgi:hypothetical protein
MISLAVHGRSANINSIQLLGQHLAGTILPDDQSGSDRGFSVGLGIKVDFKIVRPGTVNV